jgi:hypothetical protein
MKSAGAFNGLPRALRQNMQRISLRRKVTPFWWILWNDIRLIYFTPVMVSDPKSNEWNLLKDQFAALVHNEDVRQDCLEQILDDGIRRRFGELIAWAAGHDAKGHHGPWPPGPYRAHR